MPDSTSDTQQDEQRSSSDVCPTHERVLPTNPGNGADYDGFGASVLCYREV